MTTYAIGDIQGCLDDLHALLDKLHFDPDNDVLWFAGDLVNRGNKSLETLRFIKNLGSHAISVLGNHDLTLLALSEGNKKIKHHTLDEILNAPDRDELIHWLRHQPLLHHDATLGYTMIHAGLAPQWDLATAQQCAREVETLLQGEQFPEFMANMFGDKPNIWHAQLDGWDRLRFITNCFSRMRYCQPQGKLNFKDKGAPGSQKAGYIPWFEVTDRKSNELNIIFGHWSTLSGDQSHYHVHALDTGCLWGGELTAMKLEAQFQQAEITPQLISVNCTNTINSNL